MPAFRQSVSTVLFRFDHFELDSAQGLLRDKGNKVKLQPQPLRVLEYLLRNAPDIVSREELGDHIWGTGVHVDLDQSLNYCIRQIRQVLSDSATQPLYLETLPRQGYRFIGPLTIEDLSTPEIPLSPAKEHSDFTSAAPLPDTLTTVKPPGPWAQTVRGLKAQLSNGRSRVALLSALALVLIAAGVIWRLHRIRQAQALPHIRSIAVLPLDNLSGEPGHDYFVDGMTDELITMLVRDSTLEVRSRTSVMQYKGVHRPLREIAHELGVDAVLEGSLVQRGDSVHMTLQLIKASSDVHLLAESYDRDVKNVASLPDEAAQAVAHATQSGVRLTEKARYIRPEAHDAYLRGHYLWFANANELAGEAFRAATELQPDYAAAWSGLSAYYGAGAVVGTLAPEDSLGPAEAAARKAIELDPSLPEAHLVLGSSIFINRWDWVQAQAEISRAIELDPKFAEAYHFRAKILAALNRHDEAIQAQRIAAELDPFARPWALVLSLLLARRYDEALLEANQRLEANPMDSTLYLMISEAYRRKGAQKESVQMLERQLSLQGNKKDEESVQQAFRHGNYEGVLRWRIASLEERQQTRYVSPVELALLYAELHEREKSLSLLEEGLRQRAPALLWIQNDPAYDFLHKEERYRAIVRKVGLPEAFD